MIYLNNRTDKASSSNLKIWGLLKVEANSTAYGLTATAYKGTQVQLNPTDVFEIISSTITNDTGYTITMIVHYYQSALPVIADKVNSKLSFNRVCH
jgi:hypothetical protein